MFCKTRYGHRIGFFLYPNPMNDYKLSQVGLAHIKRFEGLRLKPYRDSAGNLTIGYGCLLGHEEIASGVIELNDNGIDMLIHFNRGITHGQAEALLKQDVKHAEDGVKVLVEVPLTRYQFDALVSFVFNVGWGNFKRSTLLKKLNSGDYAAVPTELKKWRKAGGKVLAGLVKRREATAKLWCKQYNKQQQQHDSKTWRQAEVKHPVKSRTLQGAAVAASGQVVNWLQQISDIKAGADQLTSGIGEYAQWLAIALTLAGLAYIVYARCDDRREGLR